MTAIANAVLHGGCHCGKVRVVFETALLPSSLQPRACDCSFCRSHDAAWVSDADGRIRIDADDAIDVRSERQGSGTARFLLCAHCGVPVVVVFEAEAERFGAVNARCLVDRAVFAAEVIASPQRLSPAERVDRWRTLWARDVVVPSDR
ncbi:MAG: aldehyde-activating protein [Lysobacter sp.]|nr:aldehyde-activating protein [Lysobacter sp.]